MKELLNTLPKEIIEDVKETLKAYNRCNVIFEDGKYSVRVGNCISRTYAQDRKLIEFKADEIYTKREMIINHIEIFKSFPCDYELTRDSYKVLSKYENNEINLEELVEELNI